MVNCELCHEAIIGEYLLHVRRTTQEFIHVHCYIASVLEPGQLSDVVSATWGGQAGKRAITIERFEGEYDWSGPDEEREGPGSPDLL